MSLVFEFALDKEGGVVFFEKGTAHIGWLTGASDLYAGNFHPLQMNIGMVLQDFNIVGIVPESRQLELRRGLWFYNSPSLMFVFDSTGEVILGRKTADYYIIESEVVKSQKTGNIQEFEKFQSKLLAMFNEKPYSFNYEDVYLLNLPDNFFDLLLGYFQLYLEVIFKAGKEGKKLYFLVFQYKKDEE